MATKNIVGHLVYKITGDSKELDTSLKGSQNRVAKWSKFLLSAAGIGGAIIALRTLTKVAQELIGVYGVQELAENRLAAAIKATGGDVDVLLGQYKGLATQIQRVTTVGDEQTLGLIQQATNLGIASGRMEEATKGAIGLSKAFGIDMNTAIRGVALAFEGNYTQLSRYIPALRTAGDEAERQAILQKAMADGFAIAQSEAGTFAGKMEQLQNAWGDIKEIIGGFLAEQAEPVITWMLDFLTNAENIQTITKIVQGFGAVFGTVFSTIVVQIKTVINYYKIWGEALETLWEILKVVFDPRQWGQGRIKEELQELADATVKITKDVVDDWTTYAENMAGRWKKVFSDASDETIGIVRNQYKLQVEEGDQLATDRIAQINAEVDAAMTAYQLRLDAEQAYQEEKKRIEDEARAQEKLAEEKAAQDRMMLQQEALDSFVEIWGQLQSLNNQRTQYEIAQLERQQAAELATFEGTEEEKQALIEQFEKQKAKVEYEGALKSWKLQLTGALAAAARAIVEAAKNAWPIPAIPMMALAGIMTGIQVAAVRKAKPVPAFAEGTDFIVPPGFPNDSFPMQVESGEHVVVEPRGAVGQQMIHNVVNLDGKKILEYITEASRYGGVFIDSRAVVQR